MTARESSQSNSRRARKEAPAVAYVPDALRNELVTRLVAWFEREARDLPWRRTRDPYAIWLSEVMLQQTRVDTVIPYFERFLTDYPTVHALAAAPLEDVLQRWSGLGYYRRAKQLHLAARDVVEVYGGTFPRRADDLEKLRGVGAYTAGAIASIAFGEAAPLVDGNVIRVLSRVFGIGDDMRLPKSQARIWAVARALVPADKPSAFNQGLMELGSQICTPRAPACETCPLRGSCVAGNEGRAESLPLLGAKKAPRAEAHVAAVLVDGERVVLGRRGERGLYAGMWEPPLAPDLDAARVRAADHGLRMGSVLVRVGEVRHVLSHRRLAIELWRGELEPGGGNSARRRRGPAESAPDADAIYDVVEARRPDEVPLSTLAKKLLRSAGVALAFALSLWAGNARAAEPPPVDERAELSEAELSEAELARLRELSAPRGATFRVLASATGGRGLRFNNPFRLGTQLGPTAESVSLTAPYVDAGLGLGLGDPFGLQHGPVVHASFATEGVSQPALSAGYAILKRGSSPLLGLVRAGVSVLTAPDVNVGAEVALGGAVFVTGALGVTAELVGNLFYGAGTYEAPYTVIPVISLQAGLIVDLEVLP